MLCTGSLARSHTTSYADPTSRSKRTPRPQLEPQITSLDKCNINQTLLETPVYSISWVGVGGSYSIGGDWICGRTKAFLPHLAAELELGAAKSLPSLLGGTTCLTLLVEHGLICCLRHCLSNKANLICCIIHHF